MEAERLNIHKLFIPSVPASRSLLLSTLLCIMLPCRIALGTISFSGCPTAAYIGTFVNPISLYTGLRRASFLGRIRYISLRLGAAGLVEAMCGTHQCFHSLCAPFLQSGLRVGVAPRKFCTASEILARGAAARHTIWAAYSTTCGLG